MLYRRDEFDPERELRGAKIKQTVRKVGRAYGNVDGPIGSALFSGFGLQSRP
jgi:hypothetical protein